MMGFVGVVMFFFVLSQVFYCWFCHGGFVGIVMRICWFCHWGFVGFVMGFLLVLS